MAVIDWRIAFILWVVMFVHVRCNNEGKPYSYVPRLRFSLFDPMGRCLGVSAVDHVVPACEYNLSFHGGDSFVALW